MYTIFVIYKCYINMVNDVVQMFNYLLLTITDVPHVPLPSPSIQPLPHPRSFCIFADIFV